MLTEFAFTPSIFDEAIQPDPDAWSYQLERLADKMFPQGYAWPVIIANLHAGDWKGEAGREIQRISDKNMRAKAMSLLTMMEKVLVDRPMKLDWPDDQAGWCMEAIESAKSEPIERIVACRFAIDEASPVFRAVRCLSEVGDRGFWNGIPVNDSPEMDMAVQVPLLRKFCVHAGFICLITPHINGGEDDETDFAVALMRSAMNSQVASKKPSFEIHTDGPRDARHGDPLIAKYANAISVKVARDLGPGFDYVLTLWPKTLHRHIIAGDITFDASGRPVKKPRWAVSMNHVARRGDQNRKLMPADWKLLRNERMRYLSNEFCAPSPARVLYSQHFAT